MRGLVAFLSIFLFYVIFWRSCNGPGFTGRKQARLKRGDGICFG